MLTLDSENLKALSSSLNVQLNSQEKSNCTVQKTLQYRSITFVHIYIKQTCTITDGIHKFNHWKFFIISVSDQYVTTTCTDNQNVNDCRKKHVF